MTFKSTAGESFANSEFFADVSGLSHTDSDSRDQKLFDPEAFSVEEKWHKCCCC